MDGVVCWKQKHEKTLGKELFGMSDLRSGTRHEDRPI